MKWVHLACISNVSCWRRGWFVKFFFILQRLINNVLHFIFISFVGTDVSAVRETRRNKSIDHFQLRYLFNKQPLSITWIILRLQRREASVLSSVLLEHPCIDKFIDKQVFHKKFTSIYMNVKTSFNQCMVFLNSVHQSYLSLSSYK